MYALKHYCRAMWSAVFLLTLCAIVWADPPVRPAQVMAAFVYNFTQYVDWPPEAFKSDSQPFVVMVMGDDDFARELEKIMANKVVGKRPLTVGRCESPDNIGDCQVLFVPASQDDAMKSVEEKIGKTPVLTVGESDAFMAAGGGIGLFLDDGKMKFELDPDVLAAAQLHASAKLMKLAKIYHR